MSRVEGAEIELSWRPDNDSLPIVELQEQMLSKARNGWIKILTTKSYSQPAIGCLRVEVEELVGAFQNLGLAFLSGDIYSIPDFMRWLDEQVGIRISS